MDTASAMNDIGFVVIGRNEGERLKVGLRAIRKLSPSAPAVYVDSGSTDDSVSFARSLGMHVVELDMSIPFTAARARNAGFESLQADHPELTYIQFLDGDCEVLPGWIETAISALSESPTTAIVSGRRAERFPEASIYNRLMDIEWNTPVGETRAVLGDMCVKAAVFRQVGGFTNHIIAAEDDDLCVRVRAAGYRVFRLDARMSMHDANIMRLSQWYKRCQRGGHGYAQIHHIHGRRPERYFRRKLLSAAFWGGVPFSFLLGPFVAMPVGLLYTSAISRTVLRRLRLGDDPEVAVAYGLLMFTGKMPELYGALQFYKNHLLSRKHELIEYK
jgi:GT2 family glycosyltransferase